MTLIKNEFSVGPGHFTFSPNKPAQINHCDTSLAHYGFFWIQ